MKTATLVTRRLLATALGALGLGALASGAAFAQTPGEGNIPAPNVYDDQVTCSANVPGTMGPGAAPRPTAIPSGGMSSPLDDAIGMGINPIMDDDNPATNDVYNQLVYVIPPMGNNCGGGTGGLMFGSMAIDADGDGMVNAGDTIVASGNTIAVATGYSELLEKFAAVYGAPDDTSSTGTAGALATARKNLSDAQEGGQTGAALEPLQEAVNEAQDAHDKALATFQDAAGGPIYQAGVAEWMAKAAVTKSIETYNMRVTAANMARTVLDNLNYGNYVSLINDSLLTVVPVTDGMAGEIMLETLATYANAVVGGSTVGTVDEMGVTTTTASNFDVAGRLLVPMELNPDTADDPNDLRAVVDSTDNGVDQIRQRRDDYRVAANALQKLADDTREATGGVSPLQRAYDEAARRAKVEADYYAEAYNTMLADDTVQASGDLTDDTDTADVDESMTTIAARSALLNTANNARFVAEQDLRAKAAAREAATANVQASFSSPTAFYQQLVDRRQALKVSADRAVARATADGGTASKTLTDAAAAAQKNLDAATKTNDEIQSQFASEDDPTLALVQELLKNDGNDGQALVDAIGATYEKATSAVDDAAAAVEEALDGLTGEGGAIDMNTQRSMDNAADIEALDGRVTQNEADIEANEMAIAANAGNIMRNAEAITSNATNIMENRGMIETNAADIMTNAGNIMANSQRLDAHEALVMENRNMIQSNTGMIMENREMIDTLKAGIASAVAMAGMPEIGDRGVSVGAGTYDGESAIAVGVHFSGENSRFKLGISSSDGETSASVGAGWSF